MPLEIDLTKGHGKREFSPRRRHDRSAEAQSTVSDGDRDWKAELRESMNHGRQSRPTSAAPRGRGKNRGNQRGMYGRPINRVSSDSDYADYPTEYTQVNLFLLVF